MNASATRRATIRYSVLLASVHKYRVMNGDQIVGQFSNIRLATGTAHEYRGAVVLDVSVKPNRVV